MPRVQVPIPKARATTLLRRPETPRKPAAMRAFADGVVITQRTAMAVVAFVVAADGPRLIAAGRSLLRPSGLLLVLAGPMPVSRR